MELGLLLTLAFALAAVVASVVAPFCGGAILLYLSAGLVFALWEDSRIKKAHLKGLTFWFDVIGWPMILFGKVAGKFFDWIGFPFRVG